MEECQAERHVGSQVLKPAIPLGCLQFPPVKLIFYPQGRGRAAATDLHRYGGLLRDEPQALQLGTFLQLRRILPKGVGILLDKALGTFVL